MLSYRMKEYEPADLEVGWMENHKQQNQMQQPSEVEYTPRPAWQVWAARIGVVIFLLIVAAQCLQIAGGAF